jgi:integrase/recombinase XerD
MAVEGGPAVPEGMSYRVLSAYAEWCVAAGYAENTIKDRRELLMRVEGDLGNLDKLTGPQLTRWLARPGWAVQTRATYYGHLRGYYTWALKGERLQADPMLHLTRPRVPRRSPRPARQEYYRRIMAEAEPRWRMAATLARYAGLRAAEIARAVRSDMDEMDIRVLGKGGRVDMLPMHPAIWELVEHAPPGPLVLSVTGVPYTPAGISHAFGVRLRKLCVPRPMGLHMLRHAYATSLLRAPEDGGAGANLRIVQELCRHASVATTANYTQVTDRERRAAIGRLAA